MTPAELALHPKVEGAIDRLADRIRSNGGISIPREAIADLLATLLTVLRESEGPVLDFEAARLEAQRPGGASFEYVIEAQAATRVAALRARVEELEQELQGVNAVADQIHANNVVLIDNSIYNEERLATAEQRVRELEKQNRLLKWNNRAMEAELSGEEAP